MAEDDDAAEEREPARAGHGQRHARAPLRVHAVMPVADEQERDEARQLPEDDELDEVAGEDDAEHRAHEREEERVEARHRIFGRHVVARVQTDERADDGDEHREHPGEAVDPQDQVEPERGNPRDRLADHAAVAHPRKQTDDPAAARRSTRAPPSAASTVRARVGSSAVSTLPRNGRSSSATSGMVR